MTNTEQYYREHLIPEIIDTKTYKIVSVQYADDKYSWKINLSSPDHLIEITLYSKSLINK